MMRKNRFYILIILPFLLVAGLVTVAVVNYNTSPSRTLMGTYATSNGGPSAEYFAFMKDGDYCHFRQFQKLDEGTFVLREKGICTLTSAIKGTDTQILFADTRIYRMDEDGYFFVYDQLTKTPTLINVDNPTDEERPIG